MHHAGEDGSKLLHLHSTFLVSMQFNLLPAGARSHLLSQVVTFWCHDFFLIGDWSGSWNRDVVGVAASDVEGWVGVHVMLVGMVELGVCWNVMLLYWFRVGNDICGMIIMMFWDIAWVVIGAIMRVHLLNFILDEVWHFSFCNG